jgi:hypothetical protein
MWEPQPLTTLRASKACRGENFTLTLYYGFLPVTCFRLYFYQTVRHHFSEDTIFRGVILVDNQLEVSLICSRNVHTSPHSSIFYTFYSLRITIRLPSSQHKRVERTQHSECAVAAEYHAHRRCKQVERNYWHIWWLLNVCRGRSAPSVRHRD